MSDTDAVSRRASVKSLAFMGVAMASGMAAQASPSSAEQTPASPQKATSPGEATPSPKAVDVAAARFGKGHSCAQAVFSAFAEQMSVDYRTAMKVASGFGGGMYMGSVCGAVSGAFMALGLKYGGDPSAPMAKLVKEFGDRFKAKHRFVNCSELIGIDLSKVDLSNPEAVKALKEKVIKEKNPYVLCGSFVRDAAEIVDAMMKEAQPGAIG